MHFGLPLGALRGFDDGRQAKVSWRILATLGCTFG
jgi:hypothetical protein